MSEADSPPRADPTAEIYRSAWAFVREAEACAEEGERRRARIYARAAVLHAAAAAEAFLDRIIAHVEVEEGLDAKVEGVLRSFHREIAGHPRLGMTWTRLAKALEANRSLGKASDPPLAAEAVGAVLNEIRKGMLDLAAAYCGENLGDKRIAREYDRLLALRSGLGKRSLKAGTMARRWFEGATGLTGQEMESGGEGAREFQRIVLKARGESAGAGGSGITVEEARLACGAVRSMIAGVCGAAGREVPQWVREIHDRL